MSCCVEVLQINTDSSTLSPRCKIMKKVNKISTKGIQTIQKSRFQHQLETRQKWPCDRWQAIKVLSLVRDIVTPELAARLESNAYMTSTRLSMSCSGIEARSSCSANRSSRIVDGGWWRASVSRKCLTRVRLKFGFRFFGPMHTLGILSQTALLRWLYSVQRDVALLSMSRNWWYIASPIRQTWG